MYYCGCVYCGCFIAGVLLWVFDCGCLIVGVLLWVFDCRCLIVGVLLWVFYCGCCVVDIWLWVFTVGALLWVFYCGFCILDFYCIARRVFYFIPGLLTWLSASYRDSYKFSRLRRTNGLPASMHTLIRLMLRHTYSEQMTRSISKVHDTIVSYCDVKMHSITVKNQFLSKY